MTLDDLVLSGAMEHFDEKMKEMLDVPSWTVDTRDSKLTEIDSACKEILTPAMKYVIKILQEPIYDNGPTYLEAKINQQFLTAKFELLQRLRAELDYANEDELKSISLDYNWLNTNIRTMIPILTDLDESIERFSRSFSMSDLDDPEEL